MADILKISSITLPNAETYYLEDEIAQQRLDNLTGSVGNGVQYKGKTTTVLTEGDSTNPIVIIGVFEPQLMVAGDLVIWDDPEGELPSKEFIFNGTTWNEFGSAGNLKNLAFKDSATGSYIPRGTVSWSNFSINTTTLSTSYTPSVTFSENPTFLGNDSIITATGEIENTNLEIEYIPEGAVLPLTFEGIEQTLTIYEDENAIDKTYVPSGTINPVDVTIIPEIDVLQTVDTPGTLPSFSVGVEDEILSFEWNAGTLPSYLSTQVVTGINSAMTDTPTFVGTPVNLSTTYTPQGTISEPVFEGVPAVLASSFSGTITVTGSYRPSGTINPGRISGVTSDINLTYTPAYTRGNLSFSGVEGTVTVS